jgi:hypothetical protein
LRFEEDPQVHRLDIHGVLTGRPLDQLERAPLANALPDAELLFGKLVIVDEKLLAFGRDEPVVFNGLPAVLILLAEDGADDTAADDASGNAASSINTSTSNGSPSSALVEGTNPKSYGNAGEV